MTRRVGRHKAGWHSCDRLRVAYRAHLPQSPTLLHVGGAETRIRRCSVALFLTLEDRPWGPRVLALGLHGLEIAFAERLMGVGEMPALAALRRRAARFRLDHGPAQRTGLAWEHVASGLSPEAGRRWAAVEFDPTSYMAWQEGARFDPWWAPLDRRILVFDTPTWICAERGTREASWRGGRTIPG